MAQPAVVSSRHRIGSYETLLELGRGGMGTAYLARAVGAGGFERLVVIKRLHRDMLDNPEALQRFLAEARVSAVVHHANVVGTQQVGEDELGPFLVLDYVEGTTLEELVDRAALKGGPIPAPIVLRIGLDALSGLDAVHTARDGNGRPLNILHRDISLQNVLIGRDGVARVADFGIAKSELSSFSTDQSYLVGKLLYLPREYLRRKPVGPTLDVYSLGVTLWLAITGVELWEGASEAQLVRHIMDEAVPPPSQFVKVAPQIEAVILRACAPEVEDRYQSAREMADAIDLVGRLTGWVASHADVLRYVEYLAARDLDARRERVASSAGQPMSAAFAPTALDVHPTGGRTASPTAVTRADVRVEPRSKLWVLGVGAAAVAGAAVAAVVLTQQPAPASVPETVAAPAAPVPAPTPPPTAAAAHAVQPLSPEPGIVVIPSASGTAQSVEAPPAPAPPNRLRAEPMRKASAAVAPPPPAQAKPPPAPEPAPSPPPAPAPASPSPSPSTRIQAPDDITKKNPYEQ